MNPYEALFPLPHSWLLVLGLLFGFSSIVLFSRGKIRVSLACLFLAAFFTRLFAACMDPFLHEWDERFHALVARNMMHHPFTPMLRVNEALPIHIRLWSDKHIWLHKQPLFLWQMALSMKLFGVSEYAVRYPAVLMGSIGVLLVYRIAYLMTRNAQIAFLAALLNCFCYYAMELTSGFFGMDQNDTAFAFYILCSIWAYSEYPDRRTLKFALLAGLFAGCAVLNKWLVGLLVYSVWGIQAIVDGRKGNSRNAMHLLFSLIVCAAIFLPWQLYTLSAFPAEARYELAYNSLHLTHAVEGHVGEALYYWNVFNLYFGDFLFFIIPAGLLLAIFKKQYHNSIAAAVTGYFILCFVFYSFIVQTKIMSYFFIAVPLGHIFIAIGIFHAMNFKQVYRYAFIPVAIGISLLAFRLAEITKTRSEGSNTDIRENWQAYAADTRIYKSFRSKVSPTVKYAFNVRDQVPFMFYNDGVDAYCWVIDDSYIQKIRQRHEPIALYWTAGAPIPASLAGYDSLYVLYDISK